MEVTANKLAGALPLIGHLPRMRRDPLGTLLQCSRMGDVARLDLGPRGDAYLVSHPDGVKRILLDNYTNYTKKTRGFDSLRIFLGQGLLTAEGDFWRKQRRIIQPAFHHARLQRFAQVMVRAAVELADRWEDRARRGETFDVAEDMMQVTLRIVGECLFSTDPSASSSAIGKHVEVLLEKFISRITSPYVLPLHWPTAGNRQVRTAVKALHRIVDEIIAQRIEKGPTEPGDLLDMLMEVEDEQTGERMSATQLRDEVLTLLTAGHETTAAALSWAWVLLARNPEIDDRLGQAVGELPVSLRAFTDLEQAPLVGQVIHEALRLYPPAWIVARYTVRSDDVCGVRVPAGHLAIVSPWVTHRRAEIFADPERFDPDRFVRERGPLGGYSKYAYFPFGGGPRVCIGNGFALMEAQIVLAVLRRRVRLALAPGAAVEPLPLLTLRCRDGVLMTAEPAP